MADTQQKTPDVSIQRTTFEELMSMVTDQAEQIRDLRNQVRDLEGRVARIELASTPPHTKEHWDLRARIAERETSGPAKCAPCELQARRLLAIRDRVRSLEQWRNQDTWEESEDWPTT